MTSLKFQIGISSHGGTRKLPFVFTEEGVSQLSGVLHSETAEEVSVRLICAFVDHFGASFNELGKRLFAFDKMGLDKNLILGQL